MSNEGAIRIVNLQTAASPSPSIHNCGSGCITGRLTLITIGGHYLMMGPEASRAL